MLELDREHYPESLLEIVEAVLLDISCPRGLPLLGFTLSGGCEAAEHRCRAVEIIWQGMLMSAVLSCEEKSPDGLSAGLAQGYSRAHLLLTADTLLTLPFEIAGDGGGIMSTGKLASAAREGLGTLSGGEGKLDWLARWRPQSALLRVIGLEDGGAEKPGLNELSELVQSLELIRWLGPRKSLLEFRDRAAGELSRAAGDRRLLEVRDLLRA